MTSSQLFASVPPSLAIEIVEYVHANDRQLYRTTLKAVAQARRVRPVFLERQPRAERFANMAASLSRQALVLAANSILSTWLLKKHGPMLSAFLDALKISHEQGVVENLPDSVEDESLTSAVNSLLVKFPATLVAIYLHAFNEMNEVNWPNLDALLKNDVRLQLKRDA